MLRGTATAGNGAEMVVAGRTIALHGIKMPGPASTCFSWAGQHARDARRGLWAGTFSLD